MKRHERIKKRSLLAAVACVSLLTCVFILILSPLFDAIEKKTIDLRFTLRGIEKSGNQVVIVAIDTESMQEIGPWSWPRDLIAKLIKNINKGKPKVIGLDITLSIPGSLYGNKGQDKVLAEALKSSGNVVMPFYFKYGVEGYERKFLPLPIFKNSAKAVACINFPITRSDERVRYAKLVIEDERSKPYPSFAKAILSLHGYPVQKIKQKESRSLIINFSGDRRYIFSAAEILKGSPVTSLFKDKIVLIGITDPDIRDVFSTPVFYGDTSGPIEDRIPGQMAGIEVHREIINTVLENRYLKIPSFITSVFIVFLFAVITSVVSSHYPGIGALAGLTLALLYVLFSFFMFSSQRVVLPMISPLLSIPFSCGMSIFYKYTIVDKEKRGVYNFFKRYLSPFILEEIIQDYEHIKLGGERLKVTVLFSDIRDFTSISERLEPDAVISLLNEYFKEMTDIIFKYHGTIDKFIGDGIMAIWGAPRPTDADAKNAVFCALEMLQSVERLQSSINSRFDIMLKIGVGINTGLAVVGNVGSERRLDYTAHGDSVNLASRLESLNKEYQTQIIIGESTYQEIKDSVKVRFFDEVSIKGKTNKVKIYEVLERVE